MPRKNVTGFINTANSSLCRHPHAFTRTITHDKTNLNTKQWSSLFLEENYIRLVASGFMVGPNFLILKRRVTGPAQLVCLTCSAQHVPKSKKLRRLTLCTEAYNPFERNKELLPGGNPRPATFGLITFLRNIYSPTSVYRHLRKRVSFLRFNRRHWSVRPSSPSVQQCDDKLQFTRYSNNVMWQHLQDFYSPALKYNFQPSGKSPFHILDINQQIWDKIFGSASLLSIASFTRVSLEITRQGSMQQNTLHAVLWYRSNCSLFLIHNLRHQVALQLRFRICH
jgi:hypothetical protein